MNCKLVSIINQHNADCVESSSSHRGNYRVSKGKIFDCVMAITAKDNKVECIYTENIDDFKKYSFLKAVNPFK
jgi:predicted nucleic acid-binding protein